MRGGAHPRKSVSSCALSRRLLLGFALATVSSHALAHGEGVLLPIGLQAISFFGCVVALGISKYLKSHRSAAAGGILLGLASFFWPLGALPYRDNATLINIGAVLVCPVLMLCAHSLAKWRRARPSTRAST